MVCSRVLLRWHSRHRACRSCSSSLKAWCTGATWSSSQVPGCLGAARVAKGVLLLLQDCFPLFRVWLLALCFDQLHEHLMCQACQRCPRGRARSAAASPGIAPALQLLSFFGQLSNDARPPFLMRSFKVFDTGPEHYSRAVSGGEEFVADPRQIGRRPENAAPFAPWRELLSFPSLVSVHHRFVQGHCP